MAAALVMTSVACKARELGIPEANWVYLHGCADAAEIWNVSERVNYHTSPAIRVIGRKAFGMAGIGPKDLSWIDLYSCFPSAVELGCQELGFATDDPRGLTITGGLPYFGGAGNDYVMHSIVMMTDRLRKNPGKFGLCTGNGWYVTKHSAGVYSTKPVEGAWSREYPKSYQAEIDAETHPRVTETPSGAARIETYTVVTDRRGKRFGIVAGRQNSDDARFLAHTLDDDATLNLDDLRRDVFRTRRHGDDGKADEFVRVCVVSDRRTAPRAIEDSVTVPLSTVFCTKHSQPRKKFTLHFIRRELSCPR